MSPKLSKIFASAGVFGKQQEPYIQAKPGTHALKWFLDSAGYRNHDLTLHTRFTRALVHCLIGESASDSVLEWLSKFSQTSLSNESECWPVGGPDSVAYARLYGVLVA